VLYKIKSCESRLARDEAALGISSSAFRSATIFLGWKRSWFMSAEQAHQPDAASPGRRLVALVGAAACC
jgi:hypothetical protein